MAGIGDEWGTREELLHPRGPDGRWIRKAGIAKGIIEAVLGFLANFRPRMFQNRNQASQYLQNISHRQGRRRMQRGDQVRLSRDLTATNADLRDGVIDEPATKTFVDMMDRSATELPDDVILTRIVGVDAFGFTPETAKGTSSDTDPGIRGMSGKLIADRGYGLTTVGGPEGAAPAGTVRMVIAAKKGTKVTIPAAGPTDTTVFLDRGQPLRVTKVAPDGAGGWTMYVTAEPSGGRDVPEPIGGPVGEGRRPSKEREASIRQSMQELARIDKTPDEQKEQADIEARQRAAEANAQATPTPSPAQEAERRRVEALPQQPAPGEPPPRTEPPVGTVGGPGAPAVPAQAPETTVPSRAVDLRLAVRDAKVPSPSSGPRRRAWNEAYLGVSGGKKDPIDAVRELDADIATLRRGEEIGRGAERGGSDESRDSDVDALQQLRDVIAKEYGLEPSPQDTGPRTKAGLPKVARGGKTKLSQREQEAEERNRAAGASEAVPAPTPVKAPAKKAAKKAAAGPVRTKDQEDRILSQASKLSGPARNSEEERLLGEAEAIRARRAGAPVPVKKAAKKAAPVKAAGPKRRDDLDNMSKEELIDVAAREGVQVSGSPNEETLRRLIRNDREAQTPGDDIDKMTKQQMLDELQRRGVTTRKSWNKDQLKKLLRGEDAQGLKTGETPFGEAPRLKTGARAPVRKVEDLTPEEQEERRRKAEQVQRQAEIEEPADLDKMTKRELIAEAGRRGVTARDNWTKDKIKDEIRRREKLADEADEQFRRDMAEELKAEFFEEEQEAQMERAVKERIPEAPAPAKKAARGLLGVPNSDTVRQALVGMPADDRFPYLEDLLTPLNLTQSRRVAKDLGVRSAGRSEKPEIIAQIVQHFEGAGDVEAVARLEGPPAPVKKAAKAAVPGAAPGRIDRVGPRDINVGDEILIEAGPSKGTSRGRVARIERSGGKGSNNRYRFFNEDGEMFRSMAPNGKTNVRRGGGAPEPGAAPARKAAKAAAPDSVQVARERQAKIDRARGIADTAAELDQLITDEASTKALLSRVDARIVSGDVGEEITMVRDALNVENRDVARRLMRQVLADNGITSTGNAGDIVPFNRREHAEIAGTSIADGDMVRIVRPGHRTRIRDEDIDLGRSVVEPATPEEIRTSEQAKRLVPEGSVPGTRTDTPVDNAPRKRELRQAWIAADIQPPAGPVRTQTHEIRDKLLAGEITPEESIRMMESEIALNKEDLAELDAHLREADLTDRERKEFQDRAVKLTDGIREQEKASTFLRMYFKDEAPVVSLKEAKEVDPVSYEFLKDATPDDMREAAKEAGLDAPSGDTPDEMFTDLLKQVARNELARRAAKKAAKKAAPAKVAKKAAPEVPRDKERVDARLLAEGIDLDDDMLDMVQRAFDGDDISGSGKNPSPAKIADALNGHARHQRDSTGIRFGKWEYGSMPRTPEEEAERQRNYDAGIARAQALEELAGRVRGVRRRSFKKAAPSTPEVAKLQDKVDDLEKRRIDDALGELTQSGDNRDRADAVLEGLTLPELRRLAEQSGVPTARTKRGLRDNILDRFAPRPKVTADDLYELPSRDAGREALAPLNKAELMAIAEEIKLPRYKGKSAERLRLEILEGTTGARLDSIATRGFTGPRPDMPDAPRRKSLSRRATEAGITHPGETFSDVDSAVGEADRRLQGGESPTTVAKFLRQRAARVAKADINEEGRRFPTNKDKDSLLSIRKSSAEYLRRVATHVQQEGKATKATPAKKAAPSAPEAPDTSAEVKKLRDRARVTRELAGMRQANNAPGSFHHNKGLQDEKDADRLDAEADALERGSAPAPAKKAAKKAAPSTPGAPSPSRTGTSPVGGTKSTAPEIKNNWGMLGTGGEVEFHDDGVIGQRLRHMGDDRLMDVDGEPLSNVIGKLATRAVRGEISQEQLLMDLDRLYKRLPAGSRAKGQVKSMMEDLDAPARPMPDLPDGAPAPFRTAIEKLLQIPLARDAVDRPGFHRDRENSEVDKLLRLLEDFNEGRTGGLRFITEIMNMRTNLPHESQEGRFEIDRVLRDLHAELDRMYKNPELRPQLMPRERGTRAPKKATPRLTAIPGGGTGRGRGTRPKLTVVRNEQGEFAVAWV